MENINDKTPLSKEEMNMLREKFLTEYSKKRGWNPGDLTSIQLMEIVNQNEYKNPGLILS